MGYDNWCYRCYNLAGATCVVDLNKCDGCKGREHPDLAPTKFLSNIIDEINRMFPEKHVCIRREKNGEKRT